MRARTFITPAVTAVTPPTWFTFAETGFGEEGFGSFTVAAGPPVPVTAAFTWLALGEVGFGEEGFGSFQPLFGPAFRSPDPYPGFVCPLPLGGAPVIPVDRLTAPTGDDLLPVVIALAPRGRAWQTDETAAPPGTTVQHKLWSACADALAGLYGRLTTAARAAFPSVTAEDGLRAWEADYELPGPYLGLNPSVTVRRAALRGELALPEINSRQNLVCLAQAAGFDIAIDEREGFEFGLCGFGDEGFGHPDLPHVFFVIAAQAGLTWLSFGEVGFGEDGFGSLPADGLVGLIERARQAHSRAIYVIDGVVL